MRRHEDEQLGSKVDAGEGFPRRGFVYDGPGGSGVEEAEEEEAVEGLQRRAEDADYRAGGRADGAPGLDTVGLTPRTREPHQWEQAAVDDGGVRAACRPDCLHGVRPEEMKAQSAACLLAVRATGRRNKSCDAPLRPG